MRILCVGCATGEEPYSIRMALRERWGNESDRDFAITGADLDREALATARRGRYRPLAFRALDPERQARWFTATRRATGAWGGQHPGSVDFLQLNLLAATYPEALAGQDLIFYRNLSIYFDAPTRQIVMGRLGDLLQPAGYLLVGLAETLANDYGLLTLRDQGGV
ncbi:MAG: protein-glutamate O-methyltransferase CheR, partial [Chromatiaceae bacterium]|nr:protein-glutamate O-methyltransferase CheR [Chromatiaceae bacterium]